MDAKQALAALEKAGTAQNRTVYARHGVQEPLFGVSYAELGKLEKRIGRSAELARALWDSGIHDARVLATRVADAAELKTQELRAWAKELGNYVLTDAFSGLVARSRDAWRLASEWIGSRSEWISTAGWNVIAQLLKDGLEPAAKELEELVERIERGVHAAPNRTRYAMNNALIAIGVYRRELRDRALAAAERIGPVEVDHGETGCKTPLASEYIAKAAAHRERKAGRTKGTTPDVRRALGARTGAATKTRAEEPARKAAAKRAPARAAKKGAARRSTTR
jgi:3-methyladenine DNA glycosylase AlkD